MREEKKTHLESKKFVDLQRCPLLMEDCIICTEAVTGETAAVPNCCKHMYHHICIKNWTLKSSTCPLDRLNIESLTLFDGRIEPVSQKKQFYDHEQALPSTIDDVSRAFCYVCHSGGREDLLILCDGNNCSAAGHFDCDGLVALPGEEQCWYCPQCRLYGDSTAQCDDNPNPPNIIHLVSRMISSRTHDRRLRVITNRKAILQMVIQVMHNTDQTNIASVCNAKFLNEVNNWIVDEPNRCVDPGREAEVLRFAIASGFKKMVSFLDFDQAKNSNIAKFIAICINDPNESARNKSVYMHVVQRLLSKIRERERMNQRIIKKTVQSSSPQIVERQIDSVTQLVPDRVVGAQAVENLLTPQQNTETKSKRRKVLIHSSGSSPLKQIPLTQVHKRLARAIRTLIAKKIGGKDWETSYAIAKSKSIALWKANKSAIESFLTTSSRVYESDSDEEILIKCLGGTPDSIDSTMQLYAQHG